MVSQNLRKDSSVLFSTKRLLNVKEDEVKKYNCGTWKSQGVRKLGRGASQEWRGEVERVRKNRES